MDFTQHSKINSSLYPQNRQQRFLPQPQSLPKQSFPKNQLTSKFQRPLNLQQLPAMGSQRRFIPASSAMYDCQPELTGQKNSFYEESLMNKSDDMQNPYMQTQEPTILSDYEDSSIEYFQCTPSPSISRRDKNPFKHVMNSMQQFTKSRTNNITSCPNIGGNHQTFCFKHDDDNEEVVTKNTHQKKTYRSHTSIEKIPKGLKIITEILTEDGEDDCETTPGEHLEKKEDYCVNQEQKTFEDGAGDERD